MQGRTGDVLAQSASNQLEQDVAKAMLRAAEESSVTGQILIAKPCDVGAHVIAQKSALGPADETSRISYFQYYDEGTMSPGCQSATAALFAAVAAATGKLHGQPEEVVVKAETSEHSLLVRELREALEDIQIRTAKVVRQTRIVAAECHALEERLAGLAAGQRRREQEAAAVLSRLQLQEVKRQAVAIQLLKKWKDEAEAKSVDPAELAEERRKRSEEIQREVDEIQRLQRLLGRPDTSRQASKPFAPARPEGRLLTGKLLEPPGGIEDGGSSPIKSPTEERHDAALAGIERHVKDLNLQMNILAIFFFSIATSLLWAWWYDRLPPEEQLKAYRIALQVSIPVVALFFTWFHIWLAIQMMFLPLKFWGIWQYQDTGMGIGWQGVVPRKCTKMARTAFKCARPYLMGPRDWFARVDTSVLFSKMHPMLERVVRATINSVSRRHFPSILVNSRLPSNVEEELVALAMEQVEETFPEMWDKIVDLLCDSERGLDNDGMIVSVFTQNKALLNLFFLSLGEKEFRFIERCGAALGFVCGLIQLMAFNHLDATGRMILLPGTGFFLGIFTNWLAIQMCFKPCFPRPINVCGKHIYTIQGLFLKRQRDVAVLYSKMLVDHFFDFDKVVEYLQTLPVWADLHDAYCQNTNKMMRKTMGPVTGWIARRVALGPEKFKALEDDLVGASAERIAESDDLHEAAAQYISVATDVFRSNASAMQRMPPDEFENLLHPVFQEDEWILILLGGILGAIVGIAQVHFLSE
eukprot:g27928.t1